MIQMTCPHCEYEHSIPDQYAGRSIRCKRCNVQFVVPNRGKAPSAPQTPIPPTQAAAPARPITVDLEDIKVARNLYMFGFCLGFVLNIASVVISSPNRGMGLACAVLSVLCCFAAVLTLVHVMSKVGFSQLARVGVLLTAFIPIYIVAVLVAAGVDGDIRHRLDPSKANKPRKTSPVVIAALVVFGAVLLLGLVGVLLGT